MTQNEDYITYEQAAALKQAGFDWVCRAVWHFNGENYNFIPDYGATFVHPMDIPHWNTSKVWGEHIFAAPTLAQAQKWLREVHNLYVLPHLESVNRPQYVCHMTHLHKLRKRLTDDARYFPTYEAALSAGITAALKLITDKIKRL